jgi:hypothetical protein
VLSSYPFLGFTSWRKEGTVKQRLEEPPCKGGATILLHVKTFKALGWDNKSIYTFGSIFINFLFIICLLNDVSLKWHSQFQNNNAMI